MATLVFSALGSALGGPLGGALGGLVGRSVDQALFAPGGRQGPRLNDLRVTTSSYGAVIPQHYGAIRASGTIIWSTDLIERSEKRGGGKGAPSLRVYSYSASFAVALSSRPIRGVGRIWADGTLLRGSDGDLKVGGAIRVYSGHGDHVADPLIASDQGAHAPAFRGLAYIVFEELDLADFGNRIPALTFEIFADEGEVDLAPLLGQLDMPVAASLPMPGLAGLTCEEAPAATLAMLNAVYPLAYASNGQMLKIWPAADSPEAPPLLPEAASSSTEGDFGQMDGRRQQRQADERAVPTALRYYDVARDYLVGMQRTDGRARTGQERAINLPGALAGNEARSLINAAAQRAGYARETLSWRMAMLDPALGPGVVVRAPGHAGYWRITSWEWRDHGVELQLTRLPHGVSHQIATDSGTAQIPPDLPSGPTILRVFGIPWDGQGHGGTSQVYAALSSAGAGWKGAALHTERAGTLLPLGSGRQRARMGHCVSPLPASAALLLERGSEITIQLAAHDLGLDDATPEAIAYGANRLLIGAEILQFMQATALGGGQWRLQGLLRGRAGTEAAARIGHPAGEQVTLLDDTLIPLDAALIADGEAMVLATGPGDISPVAATPENSRISLQPLVPVHPRADRLADGAMVLRWCRRARGAWVWQDGVDAPLGEQAETYRVGVGSPDAPLQLWDVAEPRLELSAPIMAGLLADHLGEPIWVRQIGDQAISDPLHLTILT